MLHIGELSSSIPGGCFWLGFFSPFSCREGILKPDHLSFVPYVLHFFSQLSLNSSSLHSFVLTLHTHGACTCLPLELHKLLNSVRMVGYVMSDEPHQPVTVRSPAAVFRKPEWKIAIER